MWQSSPPAPQGIVLTAVVAARPCGPARSETVVVLVVLRQLSHRAQPLPMRYDARRDIVVVARAVHVETFVHRLIVAFSGSAMRELQPAPYTPRPETIPPFRCGTPHAATLLLFSRERDSTRSRSANRNARHCAFPSAD